MPETGSCHHFVAVRARTFIRTDTGSRRNLLYEQVQNLRKFAARLRSCEWATKISALQANARGARGTSSSRPNRGTLCRADLLVM